MEQTKNNQVPMDNDISANNLTIFPSAVFNPAVLLDSLSWKVRITNRNSEAVTLRNCFFQVRYVNNDQLTGLVAGEASFQIGDNGLITIPAGTTEVVEGTASRVGPFEADMDVRFSSTSPFSIYERGPLEFV